MALALAGGNSPKGRISIGVEMGPLLHGLEGLVRGSVEAPPKRPLQRSQRGMRQVFPVSTRETFLAVSRREDFWFIAAARSEDEAGEDDEICPATVFFVNCLGCSTAGFL